MRLYVSTQAEHVLYGIEFIVKIGTETQNKCYSICYEIKEKIMCLSATISIMSTPAFYYPPVFILPISHL